MCIAQREYCFFNPYTNDNAQKMKYTNIKKKKKYQGEKKNGITRKRLLASPLDNVEKFSNNN